MITLIACLCTHIYTHREEKRTVIVQLTIRHITNGVRVKWLTLRVLELMSANLILRLFSCLLFSLRHVVFFVFFNCQQISWTHIHFQ